MKDQPEQRGLLDNTDSESDHSPQELEVELAAQHHVEPEGKPKPRRFPTWFICLGVTLLLGVLALPLLGSAMSSHTNPGPGPGPADPLGQLAVDLHPVEHTSRDPTTLAFEWNITTGIRAPDGVEKQVYLVNGQFPGPTIEGRSGDRIIVHVHNGLEDEGVSLHWHGLRMLGFNAQDGAVGFTQCPIPAGRDFTYDFRIGDDEHGTFWWHSHSQVQRGDGLFGGLVVHQPRHHAPDGTEENEALLLVGDWFHRNQADVLAWYAAARNFGSEPVPDSLLINGHGRYNCSLAVPARPVQCNQLALGSLSPLFRNSTRRIRLRVVNTGTIAGLTMMVDGATLQVLEVDGGCSVASKPLDSVGILYPGERVDLNLEWKQDHPAQPWLNIYLDDENFGFANPALNPNQTFPALPKTLTAIDKDEGPLLKIGENHQDLAALTSTEEPNHIVTADTEETIVFYVKTQKLSIHHNRPLGFVNRTFWQPQPQPLLSLNRSSWDEHQLVPFIGTGSKPTLVKVVVNNLDDGSHPFHLHGHFFHILSSYRAQERDGFGSFNPFETPDNESPGSWNRMTPLRKDTVSVPRRGHVVLSFVTDNPGVWMFHCHMLVHLGTGMATGFHVGVNGDQEHILGLDPSAASLCTPSI